MLHFICYFDKVRIRKKCNARKEGYMGNNNQLEDDEELFVTLTLDDDTEVECQVLTIFEAMGKDYIALLPVEEADDEEGGVYLYRYFEDEDGEPGLENIETDYEFEVASEAFDQLLEDDEDEE